MSNYHKFYVNNKMYYVHKVLKKEFEEAVIKDNKHTMFKLASFVVEKGSIIKNRGVSGEVMIEEFLGMHGEKYE